jgi:hypothetical protein
VTRAHGEGHDPHQLHPDHLPTPFTADEIRVACQPGRTLRFRIERAGEEPVVRVSRYVSADAEGAVQESWAESIEGLPLAEPEPERSTWLELQEHASFPTATTSLAEEELSIPAGRFDCLRYTREDSDSTWRFWFARNLPGQPIRFEHQVGDSIAFSATLLENVRAGSGGASGGA